MFDTLLSPRTTRPTARWSTRWASEEPVGYATAPAARRAGDRSTPGGPHSVDLLTALECLEDGIEVLAAADVVGAHDTAITDAVVRLQRLADRIAAAQIEIVDALERRGLHTIDGAGTVASWLRARTNTDHATATNLAKAAVRTRHLPTVREALADGSITYGHVTTITRSMTPRRRALFEANEATLVDLAQRVPPKVLGQAIHRLRDIADAERDGDDAGPLDDTGPDERRELHLTPTIDGLWDVRGTLDPLTGEKLASLIDAYESPDPASTPDDARRSPAQRRHDALDAVLDAHLAAEVSPTVQGAKPGILAFVDLATLIGTDDHATRTPRLARTGPVPPAVIRRILHQAKLTCVLTMGPWRAVSVGRTQRTLPSWMRTILTAIHHHCRGPDCDRPVAWSDAHHVIPWAEGGETDLNQTVPACSFHHDLITVGGWTLAYDPDTGACHWTDPQGRTTTTYPPPLGDPWDGHADGTAGPR